MTKPYSPKRILILASGKGSNAEAIINYFASRQEVKVTHVLSNNANAGALEMAKRKGVNTGHFNRHDLYASDKVLNFLKEAQPDLIVLAGFMWLIPEHIVTAFPNKIINIHPALLPKYGGKGMYGLNVHKAVLAHREKETGITIHYVNPHYDEGKIIAQFKTPIATDDDLDAVVSKIKQLEHAHYAKTIDNLLFPKK